MATPQTIRGMNTQIHKSSLSLDSARRIFPTLTSSPLIGHKDKVHSVAWNCTGSKLGSGSVDKTVRIWSFDNSGVKGDLVLKGHEKSVDQLCWDPLQENRLATASGDKTVRIWDTRTAQSQVVQTTGENIFIAWSPDSQYIAVGNKEDVLTIIDTRTFKTLNSTKFAFEVNEIKWDPSNKFLYLTTGSGQLEVMHFPAMKRVSNLYSHTSNCYCIEFDPSGRYYAIGSADALVSLWDADEMICIRTFGRLDNPVRTLSFSFDSQFIASASEDFVVDISHVETGELAYSLQCSSAMNSVAWHPSAYLLAYAGDEQAKNNQQGGAGLVSVFGYSPP